MILYICKCTFLCRVVRGNALIIRFRKRVAFAAFFSGNIIVLHLGEILWRLPVLIAVDISLVPSFVFCQVSPSPLLWGALWRLGAILWHIYVFSTDT